MVSDLQSSHVLISRWAISGFPTRLRPGKAISTRNGNVSTKTAVTTVALSGPWESSSHGASVLRAINTALTKWPQSKEVWDFEMAWNSHNYALRRENQQIKIYASLRWNENKILGLFKFKYTRSVKKWKTIQNWWHQVKLVRYLNIKWCYKYRCIYSLFNNILFWR